MGILHNGRIGAARRIIRFFLRTLIYLAFALLTRLEITGRENVPADGPLLIAANHFHFADPLAIIRAFPGPMEFVGGAQMPFAPRIVRFIPKLWGYHAVHRGTGARDALREAEALLHRGGRVGIFPEGGSWATVLRPARPGLAFLAVRTGARVVPVGIDGLTELFPRLLRGRRAKVAVRIGEVLGPFSAEGSGRERRSELDALGDAVMARIAQLIPPSRRGRYSEDPQVRAAARAVEAYPWDRRGRST